MNNVFELLNSDDKNEIKKAVKGLIIKTIDNEIKDFDRWLITYEDVSGIINSAVNDTIEEIKCEIKEKVKEKVLEKFKNI